VSIVDLETDRYVAVNDGFERLFGCRREDVVGRPVGELALWADSEERERYLEALRSNGSVRDMPKRGLRTDGTVLQGLASGMTLEIGGRRCLITFTRDLTEQLRAEREKSEAEALLRDAQKLEALGVLAGGIAHDFNNILGIFTAYTELLALDVDDPQAIKTDVQELRLAGRRARQLVQQILTFSRRKSSERRPQRLAPAVGDALELLRATLPAAIEIAEHIEQDTPIVLVDLAQIHQIVMNLATNAVQAIGARPGTLSVTLRAVDVSEAVVRQRPNLRPGPNVLLSVSDTGCGMDEQTRSRIFEPFYTTKGPGEGTGLGLAVVHGIVLGHDAALAVQSELGKGTTFEIYFPEHPAELSGALDLAATLTRGRGERVLVVEDEPALRYAVARLLERLGYETSLCSGPRDALDLLEREPARFDVVLADLSMPSMSGVELAKQILSRAPRARIVIMSGFSPTWNVERLRELGICELLSKPINALDLSRSVRAALDGTPG
jgi:PAS domain S-box-containing protein